jgi:hypothetical protein
MFFYFLSLNGSSVYHLDNKKITERRRRKRKENERAIEKEKIDERAGELRRRGSRGKTRLDEEELEKKNEKPRKKNSKRRSSKGGEWKRNKKDSV